jgi:hypothetical protein
VGDVQLQAYISQPLQSFLTPSAQPLPEQTLKLFHLLEETLPGSTLTLPIPIRTYLTSNPQACERLQEHLQRGDTQHHVALFIQNPQLTLNQLANESQKAARDPLELIRMLQEIPVEQKLSQLESEVLQEIERLKEQAEDPRKLMKIKSLLQ